MKFRTDGRAFTIIELLVVISIIALLIAILLPSLAGARDRARFAKWQGYSHGLRAMPGAEIYYNMDNQEESDHLVNKGGGDPLHPASTPELNIARFGGGDPLAAPVWTEGRWKGKKALSFQGAEFMEIPGEAFEVFSKETTVFFWVKPLQFSNNTIIYAGRDLASTRRMDVHLPWGTSISWKAGADPSIDQIGWGTSAGQILDEWHLFAFTKSSLTGQMKIYFDGKPVSQNDPVAAPKTQAIGDVNYAFIGKKTGSDYYVGVPRGDGREVGPQPAPSGPLENASQPLLKVGDPAGVRMYKFACGDCSKEQFIGYFNTWPATVREKLVSDQLDGSEVQHLEGVMGPEEKKWHPITSERGQEIVTAHRRRCGAVKPVRCEVNDK